MRNNFFESACELSIKAKELQERRILFFKKYMDVWLKEGPEIGSVTETIKIEVNGRTLTFDYVEGSHEVYITDGGDMLYYDHVKKEIVYTMFHYKEKSTDYFYVLHDESKEETVTFYNEDDSVNVEISVNDHFIQN